MVPIDSLVCSIACSGISLPRSFGGSGILPVLTTDPFLVVALCARTRTGPWPEGEGLRRSHQGKNMITVVFPFMGPDSAYGELSKVIREATGRSQGVVVHRGLGHVGTE